MSEYLLTCTCGRQTPVSTVQAGESLRCDCGVQLNVPNLRDMRALPPAGSSAASGKREGHRVWEDRHRGAFLLTLVSLVCLAVAGYLFFNLPTAPPTRPTAKQIDDFFANSKPSEILTVYRELEKGLQSTPVFPEEQERQFIFWEMGIVLSIATGTLIAAVWLARKRPQTRP